MSKTILADVDGWTPIIDAIAQEYGLITSAVFGRIWRFCQMPNGVCNASLETIAEFLGVDRSTVSRHVGILVENGYLKDLTPDVIKQPHTYADTGKAGLKIDVVAHSNTSVAERNRTVAHSNTSVAESRTKKVFNKESNRQEENISAATPRTPAQQLHDEAIDTLSAIFTQWTSIPRPNGNSPKGTLAIRWYAPLNRMWTLCGKDATETAQLIEKAIKRMREEKLTISAPQSIEKIASSIYGEDSIDKSRNRNIAGDWLRALGRNE